MVSENPKEDISDVKPGSAVVHKTFGAGKTIAINGDKIIISFGKAQKTFLFPQAFEQGFLKKYWEGCIIRKGLIKKVGAVKLIKQEK